MNPQTDHADYLERKRFFSRMLTIYGRKPVLEALQDEQIPVFRLHLAQSNKSGGIMNQIQLLAERRKIEVVFHSKEALSRISKNAKQDQGVAADLQCPNHCQLDDFLRSAPKSNYTLIALDGVTNPQNLGMIIRSVCASPAHGILLPEKGVASISPLVIKASAGTIFKSRIIRCPSLPKGLLSLKGNGATICGLSSHSQQTLADFEQHCPTVYVLGNETHGVSPEVNKTCDYFIRIPMHNGVESLNVAITAALLAFRTTL
ncbi:MAG: RNA methyltransferase [Porticoccaceae bacterium]|nr:RNA methyltransferase [Pseudomonadales bacterium]MCP5171984.1 RNA methyltransferase [Pseudomonadales bacterium]